jgi:hypothetical protein
MTGMIVQIMVEVLTIIAVATKEMKRGRLSEPISLRLTNIDSCPVQKSISRN